MPKFGYIVLPIYVVFAFWLLFDLSAAEARWVGGCFLAVGVFISLLHRALGWLGFNLDRTLRINYIIDSWGGLGKRGAQTWYLGLGLVSISIGCAYLIRSVL